MKERYKDVLEYEFPGCYQISNLGNVKLLRRGRRIVKGYVGGDGYLYIGGHYKGHIRNLKIHRLVALAFKKNPNNYPDINHKDGNKLNNCSNNLEWCTKSQNMKHAVRTNLLTNCTQKGENHNTSKHPFKKVLEIREKYSTGKYSMRQLAKEFKTSSGYISDVVNNKIRNEI